MTTASSTTDHRILIAVLRLIAVGELPRRREAETLVGQPKQDHINLLTHTYLSLAEAENAGRNEAEYRGPHLAAERFVTATMHAAYFAYAIRRAAQGARGESPSMHVWCLLNAAVTLLHVRTTSRSQRRDLDAQVDAVALTISEL